MKNVSFFLCLAFVSTVCVGQIQHVIVVIQENRTPDNLFGSAPPTGADVIAYGGPAQLSLGYSPSHSHTGFVQNAKNKWTSKAIMYVEQSEVQPYLDLAGQYGFANRMFQTNQGPSTPAHQFLFSGTSAASETSDLFESEVAGGCLSKAQVQFINPEGSEDNWGSPCLNLTTMADLLDAAGVSWRYYVPNSASIWNSPSDIQHICFPNGTEDKCYGSDWANVNSNPLNVLSDITSGKLAQVSWVVPAAAYSDHPKLGGNGGPAWIASIVNAVGQSSYWNNTAILVTWDDWGGFYDHVAPLANNTGWCPSYCYGFRVPLLMISAYTPANCIDNTTYDFGSILRYIEDVFSLPSLGQADKYANSLSAGGCFSGTQQRAFKAISSRSLTKREMASHDDPDDD